MRFSQSQMEYLEYHGFIKGNDHINETIGFAIRYLDEMRLSEWFEYETVKRFGNYFEYK